MIDVTLGGLDDKTRGRIIGVQVKIRVLFVFRRLSGWDPFRRIPAEHDFTGLERPSGKDSPLVYPGLLNFYVHASPRRRTQRLSAAKLSSTPLPAGSLKNIWY